MGNCLRLGISRVGLAWSKWRVSAKFKKKNVSIIILGMQAVGKSTIALRLYKFKRALPDLNYVQTKGFNTYTVKRNKTTINIYDLGGHPSIQELWDHYYADAHGVIFVVDTSQPDTVSQASQLLSTVLSDNRIRGKPVLLLANKIDLDGISEAELDSTLNLQHIVNSVRCLTRLDISCATDLKNDKGIFEGFKWLVTHIESNFVDINTRVLSDTMEEKKREKLRREAVQAQRLLDKAEIENVPSDNHHSTPPGSGSPTITEVHPNGTTPIALEPDEANGQPSPEEGKRTLTPSMQEESCNVQRIATPPDIQDMPPETIPQRPESTKKPKEPQFFTRDPAEAPLPKKIDFVTFPPIHTNPFLVDQPVKLPRLKSPKSRPEVISRIEDHGETSLEDKGFLRSGYGGNVISNDQYYDEKGFRFRKISAARRLSPEGADSDDGIVNLAYEPTEDISSDSTPIGVRKHNFEGGAGDGEFPNKEMLMVTTLAEVHKEYFKERKGSTSTHDSISMSATSVISEATDIMDDGQASLSRQEAHIEKSNETKKSSTGKGKSKKRFNFKSRNKTAPDHASDVVVTASPTERPLETSRNSSANSKRSNTSSKIPVSIATIAGGWERSTDIPEDVEMRDASKISPTTELENGVVAGRY